MLKRMLYSEKDVIITMQAKGWMDHKLMQKWTRKVLLKHIKGRHALLVFDTFKAHIRGAWEEYMAEKARSTHTAAAQIPTVSPAGIVDWVVDANKCLHAQTDMVKRSFLSGGIANNLDGSENGLVRVPGRVAII